MATTSLPLAITIAGALVFGLLDGKVSKLGLVTFAVGLLWLVYNVGRTGGSSTPAGSSRRLR